MHLTRSLSSLAVAAACFTTIGCGGRADVSYQQNVQAEYTLLPTIAVKSDAKSFAIEAPADMHLATDKVKISGLQVQESRANEADIRLRVSGATPTL